LRSAAESRDNESMADERFTDRVVLVTGAGTGIGRVLALSYAHAGAILVLAGRREALLEETAAAVRAAGATCLVQRADVAREEDCVALVARTRECFGRLDVLLNNAGLPGTDQPVAEMTLENWNHTIAVNVTGPMLLAREALRQVMISARAGNIQFFSSAAAKRVRARKAHYAVAKMGLIPLAQTLALEVGALGIRVNTLVIGLVAGDLVDSWIRRTADESGRAPDEIRAGIVADIPLKRAIDPQEIADLSLYLASDAASAITGQNINVTAGAEMR
jgi:NAD(P)-dependent dehydrogenase (short-subunit alcohol dehydrogenase family)